MQIPSLAVLLVASGRSHLVLADRVVCPVVGSVSTDLVVDQPSDKFNEISGLAVSPTQLSEQGNPIFFAHNDGGDGPRLGIFDSGTGEHLLSLNVKDAVNQDWESMTLGPCGDSGNACIYIADTGDNTARKSGGSRSSRGDNQYRIYKMKEPMWVDHNSGDEIELDGVLEFDYASFTLGEFADSEALFVDPSGWGDGATPGDLYVVTKWNPPFTSQTHNRIFYFPVSAWTLDGVYSPMALGPWSSYSVLMRKSFTSAEMSPDGTLLALGTYFGTYLFLRCPGMSIDYVLEQSDSCLFWPNPSIGSQMETVAWFPDGSRTLQIPEGRGENIVVTTMVYDEGRSQQTCPDVQYDEQGICRSVSDSNLYPDSWCDASTILYEDQGFPVSAPPSTLSVPSVAPPIHATILDEDQGFPSVAPSILVTIISATSRPSSSEGSSTKKPIWRQQGEPAEAVLTDPPASDATDQPTRFKGSNSPTFGAQPTNEPTAKGVSTDLLASDATDQPTGFQGTHSPTHSAELTKEPTAASLVHDPTMNVDSASKQSLCSWMLVLFVISDLFALIL